MSDWEKSIGKFPLLVSPGVTTDIAKAYYQAAVKQKDKLIERSNFDDDPYYMYETLHMTLNLKKGDAKHTYRGIKKSKDKETGIVIEEETDMPMKKFISVTAEAKTIFRYLLCAYIKEVKDYYVENKYLFPEESKLMEELIKNSLSRSSNPIIPFVVRTTELFNIESHIKGGFNSIEKKLSEKIGNYFKNKEDKIPSAALGIIIGEFVKFLHLLALKTANTLYPARRAVNMSLLFGFFYDLNTMVEESGASLTNDTLMDMKEYVETINPKKKAKGADDADDDEDSDGEPAKPKKRAPAKKKAPSKTEGRQRGRPKSKPKNSDPADDEGDIEDSIDDAVDQLGDEEETWQEGAIEDD